MKWFKSAIVVASASGLCLVGCNPSPDEPSRAELSSAVLDEPTSCAERAEAIFEELGEGRPIAGGVDAAEAIIARCVEDVAASAPESLEHARALTALGTLRHQVGRIDPAVEVLQEALAIFRRLGTASAPYADLLDRLGANALLIGDLDVAAEYFQHAREIRIEADVDAPTMAESDTSIGKLEMRRGRMEHALNRFRQAEEVYRREAPDSLRHAEALHDVGTIERKRHRLDLAEEYHERALVIRRRLAPQSPLVAASLRNLAGIALDRFDLTEEGLERVRAYYEENLVIGERYGVVPSIRIYGLVGLGKVEARKDRPEVARRYFEEALELAEGAGLETSPRIVHILTRLADTYRGLGDPEPARRLLLRALEIDERIGPGTSRRANVLTKLGILAYQAESYELSAEYMRRALGIIEGHLESLGGSDELHGTFNADWSRAYRTAIASEMALGRTAEAFNIVESYRARSFLARIAERDLLAGDSGVRELEAERERISVRYDAIQQEVAREDLRRSMRARFLAEQKALRRRQAEIATEMRLASPKVSLLRYPEPMRADEVQQLLSDGTAMLSYFVTDVRTAAFAVTADEVVVKELPIGRRKLDELVTRFRHAVGQSSGGAGSRRSLEQLSGELYDRLVAPLWPTLEGSDRLLVVPDEGLNLLPFAALSPEPGEFLVERLPVLVGLSATAYAELVARRPERRSVNPPGRLRFLGFADPEIPALNPEWSAISRSAWSSLRRRGLGDLQPLPYSKREVDRIAGLYDAREAAVHVGEDATEERVKALMATADILHFATHGITVQDYPLDSALVLTASRSPFGEGDNGLLQAWEIFQEVRLDCELVVLSACSSGLGARAGGEGLIGLTRAFHYAGAPAVVASLWDVADEATADLMTRFYRYRRRGLSTAEALQRAQIDLLRGARSAAYSEGRSAEPDTDSTAPFFWAAFQLHGDWR